MRFATGGAVAAPAAVVASVTDGDTLRLTSGQRIRLLQIDAPEAGACDPNYAGACVPRYPPDLDCGELRTLRLDLPVRVVGSDPHRLDADGDVLGCE